MKGMNMYVSDMQSQLDAYDATFAYKAAKDDENQVIALSDEEGLNDDRGGAGYTTQVSVATTSFRGMTPEELADMAMEKILFVGDTCPPVIKDQARAFQKQVRDIIIIYLKQAVKSDRTTLINELNQAGLHDAAAGIRRL